MAKATSDIVSATHTFSSNRQKTAAENKAKAEAEFEGRLKAQNDGSYEAYAKLDETERQKILINYSETYRKADAEAQNWGVGGKHRRALNAGTTLATGLLGGQSGLQSAVNAAAPYASEAIGRTFGHGENKNETAQAIGHFLLGATIARVNGGNFAAGGSAAVAAEKAAEYLAQRYNDGKTAIDPQTGEFNANLLPEHIKEEIKSKSGVIASLTGAAVGGTPVDAQTGGVVGQNAVENNSVGISYSAWKKDQALMKENPAAYSQLRTEQLQAINFLIDFIPVIGDIKGFAEAETKGDYFFATVGIIPLYGDAARKVHQAEKAYQAAKAAKNTEKMKAAIDQARRNLENIRSNVTGSDPLLAGAGNIRIPANGNVAKGDRIPDTALASKSHQKNNLGVSKGQDLGQAHTAPSTDQKAFYIREYLKDIQSQTGYRIEPNQRMELFEYIRTHGTVKPSQQELARRRAEFGKNRDALIREWEKNTGKKWPTYTEPVISSRTGRIIKPTGSKYDAHHIQPLENNGGNIWQNITPARYPEQHQGGIHRADGPLRNLQKHLDR